MSTGMQPTSCPYGERVSLYALRALPAEEHAAVRAHLTECAECGREVERLAPALDWLSYWPTEVLRPSSSLWQRLARRIASEQQTSPLGKGLSDGNGDGDVDGTAEAMPDQSTLGHEPDWQQPGPGIFCKLLALDSERSRVSMLVRLSPNAAYPPHTHAGVEELHLLDGELWIDARKLLPGDYNRAEPGTSDQRVWSETGCTCVLVTSTRDLIL